ncbi:YfgM family protein, partial [Acidihalobacter prosperus]
MTAYHVEDEEMEAAKLWWRRYGRWLTLIVIAGLIGFFSWKGWQYHISQNDSKASAIYSKLQTDQQSKQWETNADTLIHQYGNTPYAALASLMWAKHDVQSGHLNKAAGHLRWVVNHGSQKGLRRIAALRLASVLISLKQPDQALKVLSTGFGDAYLPLTQELRGDAWLSKGDKQKARNAYEEALAGAQSMRLSTHILKMKLNALPAPSSAQG